MSVQPIPDGIAMKRYDISYQFIEKKQTELREGRREQIVLKTSRGERRWDVIQAVYIPSIKNPHKVFEFLRMRGACNQIEYRLGYYVLSKNKQWTWGRNPPMITMPELREIIEIGLRKWGKKKENEI